MAANHPKKIKHLELILKISERCNINCTYCYVFNKGNTLADDSDALISLDRIQALRSFLERSATQYDIETIQIDLHGGEPLMMKKWRFEEVCRTLKGGNYGPASIDLALQTNGVLIDEEWIDLFATYGVHASVSLDGPRSINDAHRIDRKGRGTYDDAVAGLRKLQAAWRRGKLKSEPGILCVANAYADGAEVYRHFVDALGCRKFDFLVPDDHHDTFTDPSGVGTFFVRAMDEWFSDADPEIFVRIFNTYLGTMMGSKTCQVLGMSVNTEASYAFTVTSDGAIRVDDTLRSCSDSIFDPIGFVHDASLADVLNSRQVAELAALSTQLPQACHGCVWAGICGGGRIINRYSADRRFNDKSVYCQTMRMLLSRGASHLMANGINEHLIQKNILCTS